VTGPAACVQVLALGHAQAAALIHHGHMRLAPAGPARSDCPWLVVDEDVLPFQLEQLRSWGWQEVIRLRRPTDDNETLVIFAPGTS